MKLKDHFIKSLKILLLNDSECELTENYEATFCSNKKPNEETCKSGCEKCKYQYKETIDLALTNCYDDNKFYYNFGATKNKRITPITTYAAMYNEMEYLNQYVVGQDKKDDLKYYGKLEVLRIYATEFFKELSEKYLPLCDHACLPIRFNMFLKDWNEYREEKYTGGTYYRIGSQHIIDIYNCNLHNLDTLKKSIRHEIIHYALNMSNLKHEDDVGIFHALCKIYDANAYKPMNEVERKIFNDFMEVYVNIDLLVALQKRVSKKEVSTNSFLLAMTMLAGSQDTNQQGEFKEYVDNVKSIIKTVKEYAS